MDLLNVVIRADHSDADKATAAMDRMTAGARRVDTATDRMTREVDRANAAMKRLAGAALGVAAAYVGWQTIDNLVRKLVTSTVEAEAAQAQLAAALRSTGGASGQTLSSLNAHASALQKLTMYDDEAIAGAQAMLLAFQRIGGDTFPAATDAVLDLAARMGGDLNGAARQVGKALEDPIRGISLLRRAGVSFTDEQRSMIEAMMAVGDVAGAQGIILSGLEARYGGAAEAARGTLGGALAALQNAFDDLFEATGPASEQMRQTIERLVASLSDPKVIEAVHRIGAAIFGVLDWAAQNLPALSQAFEREFTTAVAYGEKASADISAYWGAGVEMVKLAWEGLPNAIGDYVYSAAQNVVAGVEALINEVVVRINAFSATLPQWVPGAGTQLGPVSLGEVGNPFEGQANAMLYRSAAIEASMNAALVGAENDFNRRMAGIGAGAMTGGMAGAAGGANRPGASWAPVLEEELNGVGGAAAAANDNVQRLTRDGLGELGNRGMEVAGMLKSAFSGMGTGIIEAFQKGGNVASNVLDMIIGKVGKFGESMLNNGLDGLLNFGINAIMGGVMGGITGGFSPQLGKGLTGPNVFGGGKGFFGIPSLDGGGDTGWGPRSGGMDGRGGFLAMLHPQETVIDRTKAGNDNGGSPQFLITNHIDARGATADAAPAIARQVTASIKAQIPDMIADYNRNPYRRAGGTR